MKGKIIFGLLFVCLLISCGGSTPKGAQQQGDTLALRHAEKIVIVNHKDYTEVTLADPWNKGKTLHRYLLVPAGARLPEQLPKGTVVRTPLSRAVISTSVHCGLIEQLGRAEAIAGVCDVQYIHLPWVQQRVKAGKIKDCGSGLQPTLETIITLNPDAIFLSPFQNSGGYGRLEKLGIPIIEMADYMETSALGRAEWMRFYGLLFGAYDKADSLFCDVEKNYREYAGMFAKQTDTPSSPKKQVLMDKITGSVWYVPGGKSTIGRMLQDAGAIYPWSDDDSSGSLQLTFENILERAAQSDVWLFRYNAPHPITLGELLSEKAGYRQFRAFQTGEVYGCNTATSTFYEDTPFHPDLLLRDFITITHPEINLGEPRYFIKVKK